MFGKWFDTAYTGSLAGSGADVFAVWTYAIAHSWDSNVELNPLVVAGLIGMPVENVERAIEFLCRPDPKSRNPAHEGRRLIYESGFKYQVVSQPIYRNMRSEGDRREYLRIKQQESRARRKSTNINTRQLMSTGVNNCQQQSTQSEAESEVISNASHSHPTGGGEKKNPEEIIYQQYPRKIGKRKALIAIRRAVERVCRGEDGVTAMPIKREAQLYLYRRTQEYARSPAGTRPDREFIPYPASWFNEGKYLDDDGEWQVTGNENGNSKIQPKLQILSRPGGGN